MNADVQICLNIPEDIELHMEDQGILREVVQKAIQQAETTGGKFINPAIERSLAFYRPRTVTYWVEYSRAAEGFQVQSVYFHRMGMMSGGGLTNKAKSVSDSGWICHRCQASLEIQTVRLQYMQCIFPHDLPVCPSCSAILISEELATGKMAEAEQALEDK